MDGEGTSSRFPAPDPVRASPSHRGAAIGSPGRSSSQGASGNEKGPGVEGPGPWAGNGPTRFSVPASDRPAAATEVPAGARPAPARPASVKCARQGSLRKDPAVRRCQLNKSLNGSPHPAGTRPEPSGHHDFQRLPVKIGACYTSAACRGAFRCALSLSRSPGVACAEFHRHGSTTGVAGTGLPGGRRAAGGPGFPGPGALRSDCGAAGRDQRRAGKRPGRECRAGRGGSRGAVGLPAAGAGLGPEVVGGGNDICDGIGCRALAAAPDAGGARDRLGRVPIGFEFLASG